MEKIKNLFTFMGHAWAGGSRGKLGVVFAIIALVWTIGFFTGKNTIISAIANIWRMNAAQEQLVMEQTKLNKLEHHIELTKRNSPDYIEELGLKRLNMGDATTKILKI